MTRDDSTSPPLPPAIGRLAWWFLLPTGMALVGIASLFFKQPAHYIASLGLLGSLLVPAIFFLPGFVAIFAVWLGRKRIGRKYLAARGRLCTRCVYSLQGLPPSGRCPECDTPYDTIADATRWKRAQMPQLPAESRDTATV